MKKLTLLTVLLLALGLTFGFAQEVKPTVTLTGSATLTAGIDLNDMSTGFSNSAATALTVNLIAADQSFTHAGEGAVYGTITISNVELYWSDQTVAAAGAVAGTAPYLGPGDTDVAAKIVAGPLVVGVYAAPSLSADSVAAVIEADAYDDTIVDIETSSTLGSYTKYGTWIGYTMAPIAINFKLMSGDDWLLNNANAYAFGLDGTLTLTPITATFGGYMGINYAANPILAYATVAFAQDPISVALKFDANYGTALSFDVGANVTFYLTADKAVYTTVDVAFGPGFDNVGGGASGLDLMLYFVEPEAGLIPGLNFDLRVFLLDLLSTDAGVAMEYEAVFNAGYKVMLDKTNYVKPWATVKYGDPNNRTENDLWLTVAADFALFPKTVITAKYASGNLMAATGGLGAVTVAAVITY